MSLRLVINPNLVFFLCLGKALLGDCGLSWLASFILFPILTLDMLNN